MDRLAVKDWLRDPVTKWALEQAQWRFNPEDRWEKAASLEEVRQLSGQRQVLEFLRKLPEHTEFYEGDNK